MKDAKMTANGIIFAFIIVGAIMAALVLFAFAKFQDNLPSYVSIPCAIAAAFIAFRVGQSWSWGPIKNAKDNVVATLCTRL